MIWRRVLLAVLLGVVLAYFAFDLGRFLNLEYFKSQQATIASWRAAQPVAAALAFFLMYVVVTVLSLPGTAVAMTLAAGAVFGLFWGTLLVSFASAIGATLAFLAARFLLRDWVQRRFSAQLRTINAGIEKEGGFYLFSVRLIPLFPFFAINLLMGLTPIRTRTFYWVSQVGMLAGSFVYVNAGTQLARIESFSGIVSPGLLASFALLGVFPLLVRKILRTFTLRKVYAGWRRPARFDCNLFVVGAGSAGLVAAYVAAAIKAKVVLVEKHRLGGDCLNTGCVPSKALIRSARLLAQMRRAPELGIADATARFSFAEVMERVQRVIGAVAPHDSAERYTGLGVTVIEGRATLVTPWEVEVVGKDGTKKRWRTRSIVIAAGARPFIPPIPGIDEAACLTSETVWDLRELPRRLLILGGGPIGCEFAQAFARFGSQVTLVQSAPRLLMREDSEVSDLVAARFRSAGIDVLLAHQSRRFVCENSDGEKILVVEHDDKTFSIGFDAVLVAVGRRANLAGYGLETLGIETANTVVTNDFLQTKYPNIYAAGDVAGPFQFTHAAAHQAWHAAVNALFDPLRKFRVDYSLIPSATFIEPEIARVGLNEREARERHIAYEVTRYAFADLDRAIADGAEDGFIKVLSVPGKDRILGVTIVGEHAGDLIAEYVLAMRHGIGLNKLLGTIHIYPTMAEANKYAAGNWKRAHAPHRLLTWLARFHRWRL